MNLFEVGNLLSYHDGRVAVITCINEYGVSLLSHSQSTNKFCKSISHPEDISEMALDGDIYLLSQPMEHSCSYKEAIVTKLTEKDFRPEAHVYTDGHKEKAFYAYRSNKKVLFGCSLRKPGHQPDCLWFRPGNLSSVVSVAECIRIQNPVAVGRYLYFSLLFPSPEKITVYEWFDKWRKERDKA